MPLIPRGNQRDPSGEVGSVYCVSDASLAVGVILAIPTCPVGNAGLMRGLGSSPGHPSYKREPVCVRVCVFARVVSELKATFPEASPRSGGIPGGGILSCVWLGQSAGPRETPRPVFRGPSAPPGSRLGVYGGP